MSVLVISEINPPPVNLCIGFRSDCPFPTPDSRLPTPDSRLPTPDSLLLYNLYQIFNHNIKSAS
ncbi:MAG: hypothetical protein F6J98_25680 [Moorea sp. SIO4G2]|uniref:hypothetical protein n=1 Tax=Moorena bouillonii TaxID=207920 RepID=UPI00117FB120|nr:hypothetical protein [Moorena bouillonii]NEO63636.1 hypothetical protein [Moorena sp. SIO4G2]